MKNAFALWQFFTFFDNCYTPRKKKGTHHLYYGALAQTRDREVANTIPMGDKQGSTPLNGSTAIFKSICLFQQ